MNPNPIKNDDDLTLAFIALEKVFQAENGTRQADERDILLALIEHYESKHYPIPHANEQGVSVHDYIVQAIQSRLASEPTMLFDIDVMKERLKGLENKEEALKNSVPVPQEALSDFQKFDNWLNSRQLDKN